MGEENVSHLRSQSAQKDLLKPQKSAEVGGGKRVNKRPGGKKTTTSTKKDNEHLFFSFGFLPNKIPRNGS